MSETIGKLGRHRRHPERLALIKPDGRPGAWFAQDQTVADIRAALARQGYSVADDGTVTKQGPWGAPQRPAAPAAVIAPADRGSAA